MPIQPTDIPNELLELSQRLDQWRIAETPELGGIDVAGGAGAPDHNDDTRMRILRFRREVQDVRTGLFTSGIVSVMEGHRIAVFMTGRQHAGENLADLLRRRAAELTPPIQMCDALSRNAPASLRVILANCLAHARRHFIDLVKNFPAECRHVLEKLREVFHFDRLGARRRFWLEFVAVLSQPVSGFRLERVVADVVNRQRTAAPDLEQPSDILLRFGIVCAGNGPARISVSFENRQTSGLDRSLYYQKLYFNAN